jgi:hypothetical protein
VTGLPDLAALCGLRGNPHRADAVRDMTENCLQFVGLHAHTEKTLGHYRNVFSKHTKSPLAQHTQTAKFVGPTAQMANK